MLLTYFIYLRNLSLKERCNVLMTLHITKSKVYNVLLTFTSVRELVTVKIPPQGHIANSRTAVGVRQELNL
jgi:dihydroorotase